MPTFCVDAVPVSTIATTEALERTVHCATNRQVQGLRIDHANDCVTVTGRSRTYYVKQLVTQAIRSMAPTVRLSNEIHVATH